MVIKSNHEISKRAHPYLKDWSERGECAHHISFVTADEQDLKFMGKRCSEEFQPLHH